jgi:transcriptional regulator with XRE-family HTH domain
MPRLRCFLKELRGPESLRTLADRAGINAGELSRIEAGYAIPRDEDVPALESAYGAPITDFYHPLVLVALEFDDAALEALRERVHEAWRRST